MHGSWTGSLCGTSEQNSPRLSPRQRKARLPEHFAAAFGFQGDTSGGPSSAASQDRAAPLPFQQYTTRRSPRAKVERVRNPSAAFPNNSGDYEYQARSTASSSRQRHWETSRGADHSEDGTQCKLSKSPPRKRIRRTRDDPNSAGGSIYSHLQGVPDLFAERNDIMLCGINPGVMSSSSGHHFAHRSNHFYPSLHLAGITKERMKPEQDVDFPFLRPYSLGLTNLAGRPTAEGNELLPSELVDGVPVLLEKIQRWKPRAVCFVGKGISEAFLKGLKQAGAIHIASSRKTCPSGPASSRKEIAGSKIRLGDPESDLKPPSVKKGDDDEFEPRQLRVDIPADVLCANAALASESRSLNQKRSSPQKPKKQLYTKGNSKDDSGYGILPLCVPHSKTTSHPLTLDDVTLFFVTPSSSARVTTHFLDDKARILKSLRRLVQHLQAASAEVARLSGSNKAHQIGIKLEGEIDGSDAYTSPLMETKTIDLEVVDASRFLPSAADTSTK